MSVGEMVDTSFRLLRDHFLLLVGIAAVVPVPTTLAQLVIEQRAQAGGVSPSVIAGLLFLLSMAVISPIVSAAITFAIGQLYLGRPVGLAEAFREALRILVPMIGTSLLAALLVLLGGLLLVIPGIWFGLGMVVLTPAIVVERAFGMKAIRRSLDLMRGSRGRSVLIFLLLLVISTVLGFAFGLAFGAVPLLGPVASGFVSAVTNAFFSAVAVVFYFDLRCRKEAFEIEHLAQLVESAAARPAAAHP